MKVDSTKIKIQLAENGITRKDFSAKCGISRSNLSTILTKGSCSDVSAVRIAAGLGVPIEQIMIREAQP